MNTVDTRGLACPEPVLIVKSELERLGSGSLQVLVNSGAAKDNISFMATNLGWQVEISTENDNIMVTLTK